MTLTVSYELGKHGDIKMTANAKFTKPKAPAAGGVAWMTDDGFLTPENPRQMKMDICTVNGKRELRSADV